jgi:hypothetical protein
VAKELTAEEAIAQLIYPFRTSEALSVPGMQHVVWHPSLLDQIEKTVTRSTMTGQVFHAAYASKPAGRIDSIAFLDRIQKQSLEKAAEFGIQLIPLRERLALLSRGLGARIDPVVTGWWISARVLTQHDEAAMALNVPCPRETCDTWGALRVRFNPHLAFCVNCHATWAEHSQEPEQQFGRLAVWVQWASEHLPGPEHKVKGITCQECAGERQSRAERLSARASNRGRNSVASSPLA